MTNPTTPTDLQRLAEDAAKRIAFWLGNITSGDPKIAQLASIIVEVFAGFSPDGKPDLDPLEFWCDLAEVLGHERPIKADVPGLVSEVRSLVSASPDAEWQPIETAPKETVWTNGNHNHGPKILAFPVFGEVAEVYWWQSAKRSEACNFLDRGGNAAHPTHWRPLPSAPTESRPPAQPERLKELEDALGGMVAAFDGEGYGDVSIVKTTRECALSVAIETLGWKRPAQPERCLDCGHAGWMDYTSGVCHWKPGRETAFESICGCHCRFPNYDRQNN